MTYCLTESGTLIAFLHHDEAGRWKLLRSRLEKEPILLRFVPETFDLGEVAETWDEAGTGWWGW